MQEKKTRGAISMSLLQGLFGPPKVKELKIKRDVKGLIKALQYKGDTDIRRTAADALGDIGEPRAIQPLIFALKYEENQNVRQAAARALRKIGEPAINPLIASLRDKQLYQPVMELLEKIGPGAMDSLVAALKDPQVCGGAARALAQVGGIHALGPLSEAIKEDTRCAPIITEALGLIDDRRSVEILIESYYNGDDQMRQTATKTIREMDWQPDRDETGALYCIIKRDWDACADIGAPAVNPLITVLRDKDETLRMGAADALEKIGSPAVKPLIAALLLQE
jgi:HEAT repeat protein